MNTLHQKQAELAHLSPDSPEYLKLQSELATFHQKVTQVLKEKFYPENYRSLCAILYNIPHGDLEAIFGAWLDELCLLGCLKWETADYYKNQYGNPIAQVNGVWVVTDYHK